MTTKKRHVFLLIHGYYGSGKTTFANGAPGPRLVLDVEGGSFDVDVPIVEWDPVNEELPTDLDPNTSVVVTVLNWKTYRAAMDTILSGEHPFNSVVLDSLTAIQKKLKDAIRGDENVSIDDYEKNTYTVWEKLLVFMEKDISALNDIRRHPTKRRVNVILVAASNMEETPRRPILQGALRRELPGWVDLEGYLRVEWVMNEATGEKEERRCLDISPSDDAIAETKCRLRLLKKKYGVEMWDPSIRTILKVINPRPPATTEGDK